MTNFTDTELSMLSDCVLYALNQSYESIKTLQSIGINTDEIIDQTVKYRELNKKICDMMTK